ncbi:MAG: HAD family hydrolase [Deltaproteobacteria bacterium]|jgi:HAD superfamily hydrolase (TIGR01509 family)|nr:HAD family hydrolase [Deltaproteobacteria bacterium]
MISTLIFDIDLTLVDSLEACVKGTNLLAKEFGLPEKTDKEVLDNISLAIVPFWEAMWGRFEPEWQAYFDANIMPILDLNRPLYPGAEDVLREARKRGITLAVATNRENPWLDLADMGIAQYIDTAVGPGDGVKPKPCPDIPQLAIKQLHTDASLTVLVGDSAYDMASARAAGIRPLGLTQGGTSETELFDAGAWMVCKDLGNVLDFLDSPGGFAGRR